MLLSKIFDLFFWFIIEYSLEIFFLLLSFKRIKSTDLINNAINNIEKILDRLQIPKSLSEIGVTEDCTNRIAEKAMKDQAYATNPKKATFEDMKEMVLQSIKKAR